MYSRSHSDRTWMHNSSVRTDLPLMVVPKASKKEVMNIIKPGQLVCVGDVYLKTHNGFVKIKAA